METWTISVEEHERRCRAANAALDATVELADDRRFGLFTRGDATSALGGGVGVLQWFRSRDDALEFIAEHLTFLSPGHPGIDPAALWRDVVAIVAGLRAGRYSDAAAIDALNARLRTHSHVGWWGPFSDLLTADEPFPRDVRAWCRDQDGLPGASAPIAGFELVSFLDALPTYGI